MLIEALQMLKFFLRQDNISFTSDILTPETDLVLSGSKNLLLDLARPHGSAGELKDTMDQVVHSVA